MAQPVSQRERRSHLRDTQRRGACRSLSAPHLPTAHHSETSRGREGQFPITTPNLLGCSLWNRDVYRKKGVGVGGRVPQGPCSRPLHTEAWAPLSLGTSSESRGSQQLGGLILLLLVRHLGGAELEGSSLVHEELPGPSVSCAGLLAPGCPSLSMMVTSSTGLGCSSTEGHSCQPEPTAPVAHSEQGSLSEPCPQPGQLPEPFCGPASGGRAVFGQHRRVTPA